MHSRKVSKGDKSTYSVRSVSSRNQTNKVITKTSYYNNVNNQKVNPIFMNDNQGLPIKQNRKVSHQR